MFEDGHFDHFSFDIALNSSDILIYASPHWSPIFPQKNTRIHRFTNNTPPNSILINNKKMYSLFFPVLKGQSLVNYRDYMVNSFLITSSKENIDRSTIRTRAVCPVLDVLFAGQIDRNSGMFTLPEIQN